MKGVIKTLIRDRKFGFITGSDGVEYFFHHTGLEQTTWDFDDLMPGGHVEFSPIEGPKGPRAVEVRVEDVGRPWAS